MGVDLSEVLTALEAISQRQDINTAEVLASLGDIYQRQGEVLQYTASIYSFLAFAIVVTGAAFVIYFMLRPLWQFLFWR